VVEIALAAGNREHAEGAVAELDAIADAYGSPALRAAALSARGACEVTSGNDAAGLSTLRRALRHWQELDAPYEAALTRLEIAEALRLQGNVEDALLEARAAKAAFDRLGALPDARRAAEMLGDAATGSSAVTPSAGTRTFMFTDIVRSTRLVEAIGDEAWESLVTWHDEKLRSLFAEHRGEEVDHAGDGFLVAFGMSDAAIACAVAIQRSLETHRRQHGFAPEVRIGLHRATATSGARGYRGRGVHVAARIGALAQGNEILVSAETLPQETGSFRASEERNVVLKGVSEPVSLASLEWR
jgi:class 3 adenylate cyclase